MDHQPEASAATLEEYAIVEIFGHRRHAGRVLEVERFGTKLLRVDVPTDGSFEKGFTSHFYGGASIFSFTPTDLATVERLNKPYEPARLTRYRPDDYGEPEPIEDEQAADEEPEQDGGDPCDPGVLLKPRINGGVVSAGICASALMLTDAYPIDDCQCEAWTQEQRDVAYDWAMRVHLKASDNEDVVVPPRPDFLPPPPPAPTGEEGSLGIADPGLPYGTE